MFFHLFFLKIAPWNLNWRAWEPQSLLISIVSWEGTTTDTGMFTQSKELQCLQHSGWVLLSSEKRRITMIFWKKAGLFTSCQRKWRFQIPNEVCKSLVTHHILRYITKWGTSVIMKRKTSFKRNPSLWRLCTAGYVLQSILISAVVSKASTATTGCNRNIN